MIPDDGEIVCVYMTGYRALAGDEKHHISTLRILSDKDERTVMTNNPPASGPLPKDMTDVEQFSERVRAIYGDATSALLDAMISSEDQPTFWLNPLRGGGQPPTGSTDLAGLPGMYIHDDWQLDTHSEAATNGEIYIQNPSSYYAVQVLDPQPGEEILDLAAAPGGKTIAISAAMNNSGRIAAVEPVPARFHRL